MFFLAILTFLMAALDAEQNFMPTKYIFLLSISVRSKVVAVFFCAKFAKVELKICDCNLLIMRLLMYLMSVLDKITKILFLQVFFILRLL